MLREFINAQFPIEESEANLRSAKTTCLQFAINIGGVGTNNTVKQILDSIDYCTNQLSVNENWDPSAEEVVDDPIKLAPRQLVFGLDVLMLMSGGAISTLLKRMAQDPANPVTPGLRQSWLNYLPNLATVIHRSTAEAMFNVISLATPNNFITGSIKYQGDQQVTLEQINECMKSFAAYMSTHLPLPIVTMCCNNQNYPQAREQLTLNREELIRNSWNFSAGLNHDFVSTCIVVDCFQNWHHNVFGDTGVTSRTPNRADVQAAIDGGKLNNSATISYWNSPTYVAMQLLSLEVPLTQE